MNLFIFVSFLLLTCVQSSYPVRECESDAPNPLKCYNGGICLQIEINSTSTMKICNCKPGFTGRQCSQRTMPCSPDPCAPNGYCNSEDDSTKPSENSAGYFCRCKPGFSGPNCEENINDCLNATCYNGGSCIDGINSYECECKWPYIGRYCETRMKCHSELVCKNKGVCVDDDEEDVETENEWLSKKIRRVGPRCECPKGYEGNDCSARVDPCKAKPCLYGARCIRLASKHDYKCECRSGRYGKNCEHEDVCSAKTPCKNSASCINLLSTNSTNASYVCQCKPMFTGIHCDISIQVKEELLKKAQTKTVKQSTDEKIEVKLNTTTQTASTEANNNGSFVLVVNIPPEEFKKRQTEITREFEKKFGILLSIKKEHNGLDDMIYPLPKADQTWTKVYFVIIFACVLDQSELPAQLNANNSSTSLCLFSNANNQTEILDQFSKMSNLLPKYVNNITYEAYSDRRRPADDANAKTKHDSSTVSSTLVIFMAVSLLVLISLVSLVLIRQKRVKAPVWFPPLGDNVNPSALGKSCEYNTVNIEMAMHKKHQLGSMSANTKGWSFGKKLDELSSFFFAPPKQKGEESPKSDSSEYNDYIDVKPAKMMRLEPIYSAINHSSSNSASITPNSAAPSLLLLPPPPPLPQSSHDTPEYYPSPPESLPDASFTSFSQPNATLQPVNFKSGYGITPLSIFVISRSKVKHGANKPHGINADLVESDVVDTLVANGAELNAYDSNGETALHLAARCGLYEICEALVKHGADLSMFDNQGRNVLHVAVCGNQYNIVKLVLNYCSMLNNNATTQANQSNLLLDSKFNLIDAKTNDDLGETALIFAARLGLNDLLKLLIDFNATVNATDNEGKSPLHHCAQVNNFVGAQILLQAKANGNAQDNNEKTPLSTALDELCTIEVADVLLKNDVFVSSEDEFKYNKMKAILNGLSSNQNGNGVGFIQSSKELDNKKSAFVMQPAAKENQANAKKSSSKTAKTIEQTTSTKRKLSDAYNTNTLTTSSNSSKKLYKAEPKASTPAYTPLTPSPPQAVQQSGQYQDYSSGYYSSKTNDYVYGHESAQKQFYAGSVTNPAFSYSYEQNTVEPSHNNGGANLNLGYLNENGSSGGLSYYNNYQTSNYPSSQANQYQSDQAQFQQQQQHSSYQTNNMYSSQYFSSETYAAYF